MRPRRSIPVHAWLHVTMLVVALLASRRAASAAALPALGELDRLVAAAEQDDRATTVSAPRAASRAAPRPVDGRLTWAPALTPTLRAPAPRPAATLAANPAPSGGAGHVSFARRRVPRMEAGDPPRG